MPGLRPALTVGPQNEAYSINVFPSLVFGLGPLARLPSRQREQGCAKAF